MPVQSSARQRLDALLDQMEISQLIDRYVIALDTAEQADRDDAWYREIFTDDVRLSFPIGDRQGIDGLAEFQRQAKLAWNATLHVSANHVVDLAGDRARARAHVIGTHVALDASTTGVEPADRLDMGGYYDIEAVRTSRGWRIAFLRFVLAWTAGGGTPGGRGPYESAPPPRNT